MRRGGGCFILICFFLCDKESCGKTFFFILELFFSTRPFVPPQRQVSICSDVGGFHFPRRRHRSICRIHLFKSFKSQLLSVLTMAHCPPTQEALCPLRYSDKGTWMSTPTARRRRRIIMSGHGRLVKGERSEVRHGAAIKGVSSVNSFVYSRKRPSVSHRGALSSGRGNHTAHQKLVAVK